MNDIKVEPYTPSGENCSTCFAPVKDTMEDGSGLVTISRKRYEELLRNEKELLALYNGGVTDWDWYSDSLRDAGLYDDEDEEDDLFK